MDEQSNCTTCGSTHVVKNGTKTIGSIILQRAICRNCGINFEYPKNSNDVNQPVKLETPSKPRTSLTGRLTEAEVRAKHDNHFKVTKAAQALEKGIYIENRDFVASLKLSGTSHLRWTGNTAFDKYRGRAGSVTYWSHPESIQKMKNDGVLI